MCIPPRVRLTSYPEPNRSQRKSEYAQLRIQMSESYPGVTEREMERGKAGKMVFTVCGLCYARARTVCHLRIHYMYA